MTTSVAGKDRCLPVSTVGDETELVARLRAGDEDAYAVLFRTHSPAMLAVARRFFGDSDAAADAVQEAFISAFRAMDRFAETSRLGTWLHRITVNACLMKLRKGKRADFVPLAESPARTELDVLIRNETAAQVRACIDRLPAAYRAVILLRDIQELDTAETASRLGTPEGVVKTRLHRARHALRSLLEPMFGGR